MPRIKVMRFTLASLLMLLLLAVRPAPAEEVLANEFCPVMTDERVDPSIFVEHEGHRVYLCCNMCRRRFLADPEAYLVYLPQFTSSPSEVEVEPEPVAVNQHEDHVHDHATDHPSQTGIFNRVVALAGKFHPVLVHFPIALVFAAFFAEMVSLRPRWSTLRGAGRFCILLAAAGAIAAGLAGWAAAASANYPTLENTLEWHRWLGTSAALCILAAAVLSECEQRNPNQRLRRAYLVTLLASTILVAVTGHLGAVLIYGPDHFTSF